MSYSDLKTAERQHTRSQQSRSLATIRKKNLGPSGLEDSFGGAIVGSARSREAYSMFKLWVYSAINAIAKKLAAQPIHAAERVGASENPERSRLTQNKLGQTKEFLPMSVRSALDSGQLEMIEDHAILDHLARPNPIQRKSEFVYMSVANLLITGECYWLGVELGGDEFETWAIPTPWVTPKHKDGVFSSYDITIGREVQRDVSPEFVARTFIPDPADPKAAFSPLRAILGPVRVDESIVNSQEDMFARGINPNLLLTIAQERGPDGKPTGRRPKLSGNQRRQMVRAVRSIWNEAVAAGEPGIIDGLIESVHNLHSSPREMDWTGSAPGVKERIMQTYGVNPINLGQIEGVNRAQAVEAERSMCTNAVNPLSSSFSETLTDFFGPKIEDPVRLLLWIEPCEAKDSELELRRWIEARKNGDVSRDEYRAVQLGLPPDTRPIRGKLMSLVGGLTGSAIILEKVGAGLISKDAAVNLFMQFFEINETTAAGMVGEPPEPLASEPVPALPVPEEQVIEEEPEGELAFSDAVEKLSASVSGVVQGAVDSLAAKIDDATEAMAHHVGG